MAARALGAGRTGRPPDDEEPHRICDVAEKLFALHGYEGTSLRHVARLWGGTHVGVLHHFPTKRELYGAVLNRIGTSLELLVEGALLTPGDERDKVWRLIDQMLDWHLAHTLWTRIILRELVDNPSRASSIRRWVFADTLHRMATLVASGSRNGVLLDVDPLLVLMHLFGAAGYFVGGLPTIAAIAGKPAELIAEHYRQEARRYAARLLLPPDDKPSRHRRKAR